MRRTAFISAVLMGTPSIAGLAPAPAIPNARAPLNIGFVLYTEGDAPGTRKARWRYTTGLSSGECQIRRGILSHRSRPFVSGGVADHRWESLIASPTLEAQAGKVVWTMPLA